MPDIQKIKLDFQSLYIKSKKNPEMPEEELRTLFTKSDILENLGYGTIGKDIRLELFIKGKKSDIACIDDYGNVVFVLEFKKPSDNVELKDHFDQLWDRYVKPLRTDFGALINGYELILYRRIGENNKLELRKNLSEVSDKDCELIYNLLKKPDYSLTQVKEILNYLNKFSAPESRIYLTSDAAREHFFENFKLEEDSIFGELLKKMVKLFDYEYSHSKFLISAYDFWRKSYAKKPDKVPESWKKLLKGAGLSTSENDLYKFMFCLETTYALFTRLILAKACEDYNFQGIDFSEFIESEIKGSERRGGTFLVVWGVLVMRLIRKMRRDLVESVFEEDLFYWWTDDFEGLQNNIYTDERSYEVALMDFSRALAKVLYALYKFDFSKIIGDPLGDLYQKYFDRETRKALGEFYTPKEVVEYIVDAVDYKGRGIVDKRLLDPACGSGTFLVDALKRYLEEAKPLAEEKGWDFVLSKLCNEYHIVGFDIHPFATIMAQIQFMLVLIPKYKEALKKNPNFVLKRLPIFRTDSLIDESKSEAMTLSMFEGGRSISIKITLPVRAGDKFVDAEVIMPFRGEAISEKTGLLNIPEYFAALQALFDTVKEAARAEQQAIAQERLESNLKVYLQNKDWARLSGFFMPYGRYFLDTIKKLRTEYGDGRLVKSIEDIILAGLLKNHVEYDFVVGNPPYVRVQTISEIDKDNFKKNYRSAHSNYDLYVLFIERGIKWLKDSGNFGYIVPKMFVNRDYGEKLREIILSECTIEQMIDFGISGVFSDVTNYPFIIILNKNKLEKNLIKCVRVVNAKDNILGIIRKNITTIYSDNYLDIFLTEQSSLGTEPWELMPVDEKKVTLKIYQISTCDLESICKDIKEATRTGMDEVFIIDENKINEFNIEDELLLPKIKGKGEIERWRINWDGKYILFPHKISKGGFIAIDIDNYPNTKKYLEKFRNDLEKRRLFGKTILEANKKWYELWNPLPYELPKIVFPEISNINSFVYEDIGYYCVGKSFMIFLKPLETFNEKDSYSYITGLLNSKVAEFCFKHIASIKQGKYYEYMKGPVATIRIVIPKNTQEIEVSRKIVLFVEQILTRVKSEQRASRFPDEYIKEYRARGEEFDAHEIVFNANHKELVVDIEKSLNNEFVIKIKGAAPIAVDSEAKTEYVKATLAGRKASKDEKITILIPRADHLAKEALAQWQKDVHEAQGIAALEGEINELVYKLYGLDENDKKVIEEFLNKF